jgi:hypothetical protein
MEKMVTFSSNPPALEMESEEFDQMLAELHRDTKRISHSSSRYRLRLTTQGLVVESVRVDSHGKRHVTLVRLLRIATKKPSKSRPDYAELRTQFEAAAAKYRLAPPKLAAHRRRNAKAIAQYWKQPPAE